MLKSINPANGKTIKTFNEWNHKKIEIEIQKNLESFENWKQTSFSQRKKLFNDIAQLLNQNKKKYIEIITREMGKPVFLSNFEIEKCIWVCNYYAENAEKFLENEYVKTDADKSFVRFNPLGVILAVMPWNFPFWQVFRCIVPCIIAGNTVLLKHASNVTICSLAIEDLFIEAGFTENVLKSVLLDSKNVDRLISDNRISGVALTGSTDAGKSVGKLAGENIKKVVLELGGSDPFIVLDDVNLDFTVKQAVYSRMLNSGQNCVAAKRFIVLKDIYEDFVHMFCEKLKKLPVGDPMDINTKVGPLAKIDILETVDGQVQESVRMGAKILVGGKRMKDLSGFYYEPTVLTNVCKGMPVFDEETFGPVASITKVKDENEAVKVANDSFYGLGASIWTDNVSRAEKLIPRIEAGAVFVNDMVKSDHRMPFGGIKKSGFGRELSAYGIKEFVNIQMVYIKK